jgi:hypothetical protein
MAATTELVTSHRSSTGTVQLTHATRVKVEQAEELITILSDDSDGNFPLVPLPMTSPLLNSALPESGQKSPSPLSHPPPNVCRQECLSVVDSLRRIRKKLVRERGAGNRDFISKFFGILTTTVRQTYYRGL